MRFTEPDLFKHIGNERNTLVCTRIDIEGLRNQRTVLTVPVTKLRYFEDYILVIRQPVPHSAQGLPLYIRAVEDKAFIPDISAGFGFKINDDDDGHGQGRHTLENALEANDHFVEDGKSDCDDCDDCDVEIIRERIEAKIFPVTTAPFGNLAFGENLTNGRIDEPRPFIKLYLNDQNVFVMEKLCMNKCFSRKARRLVKITEVITREPKMYESIDRDILAQPYAPPRSFREHDYLVEGSWGCGRRPYNRGGW